MGWDLYSRKNNSYFRVTMYGWPRLRMALRFLGADVSRMSVYNDGSYVPARVAESWAIAIENGLDSLNLAIVKDRSRALESLFEGNNPYSLWFIGEFESCNLSWHSSTQTECWHVLGVFCVESELLRAFHSFL